MNQPQNPDYKFTSNEYNNKINTPAASPVYFEHFIRPLVEDALAKVADPHEKVCILDMACGHATAMEFMAKLPESKRLKITGLDLSAAALNEARANFAEKHPDLDISFIETDAEKDLPIPPQSMDMATAINAMAYKQGHMLKSLYNALKPGGKCVINFFRPSENNPYIEYYRAKGCRIYERKMEVSAEGRTVSVNLLVTDFSGFPDEKISKLGAQSFLKGKEDIEALAQLVGFEIDGNKGFSFYSEPIQAIVHNDVYTFRKPEVPTDLDAGRLSVREKITDILEE